MGRAFLAFTTSTNRGSVALTDGARVWKKQWTRSGQHSEILTPSIKKILTSAKIKPRDLEAIAVDKGPGSFTGCRLAVNVARTMAYTLGIPIFTESSLTII